MRPGIAKMIWRAGTPALRLFLTTVSQLATAHCSLLTAHFKGTSSTAGGRGKIRSAVLERGVKEHFFVSQAQFRLPDGGF